MKYKPNIIRMWLNVTVVLAGIINKATVTYLLSAHRGNCCRIRIHQSNAAVQAYTAVCVLFMRRYLPPPQTGHWYIYARHCSLRKAACNYFTTRKMMHSTNWKSQLLTAYTREMNKLYIRSCMLALASSLYFVYFYVYIFLVPRPPLQLTPAVRTVLSYPVFSYSIHSFI